MTTGTCIEVLPNTQYRIELEGGKTIIAYPSGRMKMHKIRILLGDRVEVVVDPYGGKTTNRITRRLP